MGPGAAVIGARALVKRYRGALALDGVDLEVPAGVVYGLVGPNGAGKTTLLSILAGLRRPTSGTVSVGEPGCRVAVLPDSPRFEPWLTGREVVALGHRLAGSPGGGEAVERVLEEAGLAEAAGRRVGGYSRGMLQRLGLAATVVGAPDILLLDEPAAALDPGGRREVLDLVTRWRGAATVIFSSHILADVQEVSDWVGILDRGHFRFQGPLRALLAQGAGPVYEIRFGEGMARAEAVLRARPWVSGVERRGERVLRVRVASAQEAEGDLLAALVESGDRVVALQPSYPTLEEVFLEVTG